MPKTIKRSRASYTGEEETAAILADPEIMAVIRKHQANPDAPGIPHAEIKRHIHDPAALRKLAREARESTTTA